MVNPVAGTGRARGLIDRAYAALRTAGPVELVESTGARDETRLAMEAAHANARALVVLGGDGSVSHAARGLIQARSMIPLATFAAGTGNDFAKSLRVPAHDYLAMARLLESGVTRVIDAGEIDGIPFVNSAGFGFDVEVLKRTRDATRASWLHGTPRYLVMALQQLFRYPGFDAAVDALERGETRRWLTIVFANGEWFGGAFRIAPDAQLASKQLDVIGIADATPFERITLFARALRGAHTTHSSVSQARGPEFVIKFTERPHFQADGEPHQATAPSVTVRCLPGALRVVALPRTA